MGLSCYGSATVRNRAKWSGTGRAQQVASTKPGIDCGDCLETWDDLRISSSGFVNAAEMPTARRADTQRSHAAAQHTWKKSEQPAWITEKKYLEQIQPRLAGVSLSVLSSTLGVSEPYAVDIRAGKRVPHRRHWQAVARACWNRVEMS